jgi:hypothetical protein
MMILPANLIFIKEEYTPLLAQLNHRKIKQLIENIINEDREKERNKI